MTLFKLAAISGGEQEILNLLNLHTSALGEKINFVKII